MNMSSLRVVHYEAVKDSLSVLPQFANRAEKAVETLSSDPQGEVDIDEFIDAASLVHEAIRDIRHALLLNRNPEDVDSDNEYVDG